MKFRVDDTIGGVDYVDSDSAELRFAVADENGREVHEKGTRRDSGRV